MNNIDIERAQREETRWRILRCLDAGRPGFVAETIIYRVLVDIHLPMTPNGVDVVEYTVDCDPGIARPKKWA